ncbi:MAG: outer membrane beta-barrel protein, partial [Ignavibacteriota bacterium]
VINPIVGINTFVLSADPDSTTANVSIGWTVGVNFRLGDQTFFMPGIHYMHQRNGLTVQAVGSNSPTFLAKDELDLLRIPLLVGIRLIKTKEHDSPINFNLHAGGSILYLLSASDYQNGADHSANYNTLGFTLTGGIGIEVLFLTLDVDLDYGMTKVYSESYNDSNAELQHIKSGFDAKPFGFRINLGGKYQF